MLEALLSCLARRAHSGFGVLAFVHAFLDKCLARFACGLGHMYIENAFAFLRGWLWGQVLVSSVDGLFYVLQSLA